MKRRTTDDVPADFKPWMPLEKLKYVLGVAQPIEEIDDKDKPGKDKRGVW